MKTPLVLLAACVGLLPLSGQAGVIQLRSVVTADVAATPPRLRIDLINTGDEPARAVSIEARLGAWQAQSEPVPALGPGGRISRTFQITDLPAVPGFYHAVVKVRYADENDHAFSSISVAEVITHDSAAMDRVTASLEPADIDRNGALTVKVMAVDDAPVTARIRLVLPDEFQCAEVEREISVPPGAPSPVMFSVTNASALPDSTYAVFALLEYEANGLHRSVAANGTLRVTGRRETPPVREYGAWFGGALALIVLLRVAQRP